MSEATPVHGGRLSESPSAVASEPLAAEDEARANFYALLARLYAGAPDASLLQAIAAADDLPVEGDAGPARDLAHAWASLKEASGSAHVEEIAQEYVDLFVGVGKSEVSLHAAQYLRSSGGSVLAELRAELAGLGLGRQADVSVFEDHLAAVLEAMRVLIAGGPDIERRGISEQRRLFAAYVDSWVPACCIAITGAAIANYYRRVAELTGFFVAIERDSFVIE
jgi:TorA maturation chaperone TorD